MSTGITDSRPSPPRWLKQTGYWIGFFFYYALSMVAIGAVTGCAVFLVLGRLFLADASWTDLALYGLKTGTILSGIWAPGVAIVKCFVRGKHARDS